MMTALPNTNSPLAKVGIGAFKGTGLTAITLWDGLNVIAAEAFANLLGGVTKLDVMYSVNTIGAGAFSGNAALTYVHFQRDVPTLPAGEPIFDKVTGIQVKVPSNATNLKNYFADLGYDVDGDTDPAQNLFLYTPAEYFVTHYDAYWKGVVIDGLGAAYKTEVTEVYFPDQIDGMPVVGVSSGFGATLGDVTTVEFDSDLAFIAAGAFEGKNTLTTVTFGTNNVSALVSIGDRAFMGTGVTSLILRSAVLESIGAFAFANTALTTIDITRVITIGDYAFARVTTLVNDQDELVVSKVNEDASLTAISINVAGAIVTKNGVLDETGSSGAIGAYAFAYKTALGANSVKFDGKLLSIGEGAFAWSNLSSATLPSYALTDYVAQVGAYAFANTNVSKVPTGVDSIGAYAYARGLLVDGAQGSLPYGDGVYSVGAFDGTVTLGNVQLNSVRRIEAGAFSGTGIVFLTTGSALSYLAASEYDDAGNLVYGALEATDKLQLVTIGTEDNLSRYYVVERGAVYRYDYEDGNVVSATLIKYPSDINTYIKANPALASRYGQVKDDDSNPNSDYSFKMVAGYGNLVDSNMYVGVRAFVGARVSRVILSSTYFRGVEREAFMGTGITSFKAVGVQYVGEKAFYGCTSLESVSMEYGSVQANATDITKRALEIRASAFEGCTSLTSVLGITGATWYGERSFAASGVTRLVLPKNVVRVDSAAFSAVTELVIPNMIYAATVASDAVAAGVNVYYMQGSAYDEDPETHLNTVSTYGASIATGVATTGTKVAYDSDKHFSFEVVTKDGKQYLAITGIPSQCAGHGDYHNGDTLTFAPYWVYITEETGEQGKLFEVKVKKPSDELVKEYTFAIVTTDGTYNPTVRVH